MSVTTGLKSTGLTLKEDKVVEFYEDHKYDGKGGTKPVLMVEIPVDSENQVVRGATGEDITKYKSDYIRCRDKALAKAEEAETAEEAKTSGGGE